MQKSATTMKRIGIGWAYVGLVILWWLAVAFFRWWSVTFPWEKAILP